VSRINCHTAFSQILKLFEWYTLHPEQVKLKIMDVLVCFRPNHTHLRISVADNIISFLDFLWSFNLATIVRFTLPIETVAFRDQIPPAAVALAAHQTLSAFLITITNRVTAAFNSLPFAFQKENGMFDSVRLSKNGSSAYFGDSLVYSRREENDFPSPS
jgi:hypothetical protein